MPTDPAKVRHLAVLKEKENVRFRSFLKGIDMPSEELDGLVHELTDKVWAHIDCTKCANCCREISPTLDEEDVARLAARLGVTSEQFASQYLKSAEDEENPWIMRTLPCPFLKDNRCSVYEDRPQDCREYPYLYREEFNSRTLGMISRTFTCPIVFDVWEALKPAVGFRRRR
jgi:uncharacterized protein